MCKCMSAIHAGLWEYMILTHCLITQAIALMQSAMKMLSPDHISHLGDVYYYGMPDEAQKDLYRYGFELYWDT